MIPFWMFGDKALGNLNILLWVSIFYTCLTSFFVCFSLDVCILLLVFLQLHFLTFSHLWVFMVDSFISQFASVYIFQSLPYIYIGCSDVASGLNFLLGLFFILLLLISGLSWIFLAKIFWFVFELFWWHNLCHGNSILLTTIIWSNDLSARLKDFASMRACLFFWNKRIC